MADLKGIVYLIVFITLPKGSHQKAQKTIPFYTPTERHRKAPKGCRKSIFESTTQFRVWSSSEKGKYSIKILSFCGFRSFSTFWLERSLKQFFFRPCGHAATFWPKTVVAL